MFAVIGNAQIDPDRVEEALSILEERLLPRVKTMGGFVSGTWTGSLDDKNGTSMVLFETEAAVKAVQADCGIQQDGIYGPAPHACLADRWGDA